MTREKNRIPSNGTKETENRREETPDGTRWWSELTPQTRAGRVLFGAYTVALFAVIVPLFGIGYDQARLVGPLPEAVAWTYTWYGVMNVVLIGTYIYLFRPWADHASKFLETNDGQWIDATSERREHITAREREDQWQESHR